MIKTVNGAIGEEYFHAKHVNSGKFGCADSGFHKAARIAGAKGCDRTMWQGEIVSERISMRRDAVRLNSKATNPPVPT